MLQTGSVCGVLCCGVLCCGVLCCGVVLRNVHVA